MKTHLLDTKNNKTYCGLKHINTINLISDKQECLRDITCINCINVVQAIWRKNKQ